MNIALIGSGGREHALCHKIYESKLSKNIICIPGNAGTARIAKNIDLDFLNFKKLLKTLKHPSQTYPKGDEVNELEIKRLEPIERRG